LAQSGIRSGDVVSKYSNGRGVPKHVCFLGVIYTHYRPPFARPSLPGGPRVRFMLTVGRT